MSLGPDSLNADCTCITLDRAALNNALETETGEPSFFYPQNSSDCEIEDIAAPSQALRHEDAAEDKENLDPIVAQSVARPGQRLVLAGCQ